MKLKMYVVDFEIPGRVKRTMLLVGIPIAVLLGVGAVATATVPKTFTDGQVLSAADLNDDFTALDTRLTAEEGKRAVAKNGNVSYSLDAKYCGKTTATTGSFTSGNLTGWAAAKNLCQVACGASPSAHMCTGGELVRSAQLGVATSTGWFAAETFSGYYAGSTNYYGVFDCEGWTSAAATFGQYQNMGPTWSPAPDYPSTAACPTSQAILCCD